METLQETTNTTVTPSLSFEDAFIDPLLHAYHPENISVDFSGLDPVLGRNRATILPEDTNGIALSVHGFEQADHYKYFPYDHHQSPMIAYDQCIVCAQNMMPVSCLTNKYGVDFLTLGLCSQCGFFQHIKRPPKEWYANFYRTQWDPESRQLDWPKELNVNGDGVNRLVGYVYPGQRMLEIGSGWGRSIVAFKEAGFQCVSIEATEHRSAFIRERLGIPCFTGEAEAAPLGEGDFQPESFDLIYSENMLEHVYNTREVIEHVRQLLKPDGLAYLEVPIYYQENLTLNTHGVSHTCNFNHTNFLYMLQTIGFDLVQDYSDVSQIRFLVRKAPPLNEVQRLSKLNWMAEFLPHRGLAYLLERNGLAQIPKSVDCDLSVTLQWFLDIFGEKNVRFLKLEFDFLRDYGERLDQLRNAVAKRKPLEIVRDLLPVKYVYDSSAVPIWYY